MQKLLIGLAAAVLFAVPADAQRPPREESPAPREVLEAFGAGTSDDELARAVAAAHAFPLGSLQNPVRLGGPEGAHAYLARLRCANGLAPKVGVRSAAGVGAFGSVVNSYALDCGAAAPGKVALVMDMYHEENRENRAPAGFRIEAR